MLFMLNILCDVIHDVIGKHVYVKRIRLMCSRMISEMTGCMAAVAAAKGGHVAQHFDQCFRYFRYVVEVFSVHAVYTL